MDKPKLNNEICNEFIIPTTTITLVKMMIIWIVVIPHYPVFMMKSDINFTWYYCGQKYNSIGKKI